MSERPTPETDCESGFFDMETAVGAAFARRLERERDEAREQNAKLREMAERAIERIEQESWGIREVADFWKQFRKELNQLKEGAK